MSNPSASASDCLVSQRRAFERDTVRVASVPSGHPYVQAVTSAAGVICLPDPPVEGAPAGQWWPPPALEPAWIREHATDADLLHIHFGTESFSPDHLAETIHAAHDAGWPVVQTVHDIDHPQLTDQTRYHEQLAVMLPLVDTVITLTNGAAREVESRWRRSAVVLPHPRLLGSIPDTRPHGRDDDVIGMFLKDLRPNIDAIVATIDLIAALRQLRAAGQAVSGIVRMHRRVRDEAAADTVRALIEQCGEVELIETDRLDDRALAVALNELDACVLPYSSGTHSGWLELCWDLAVPVAAPDIGFYSEQHGDASIRTFEHGSAASLAETLSALLGSSDADVTRAGSSKRHDRQRCRLASRLVVDRATAHAHADMYRALVRRVRAA